MSLMPHPVNRTLRISARPSPSESLRNNVSGACRTIRPPFATSILVGMFNPSAKTLNESARPSPLVSSQIVIRSRPCPVRFLTLG